MTPPTLKQIIEAAIFAAGEPMPLERLKGLFLDNEIPPDDAWEAALQELAEDYAAHVLQLQKVSSGYRFQVRERMSPWVAKLWEERPARYTRALLETLALVAYRQPITRGEIEDIRGVSVSTQIFKTLQDREWVRVVGHRDVPGRPALYATTKRFLDYFNLQSLDELPPLSALRDLDQAAEDLNFDAIADAVREEMHAGIAPTEAPHLAAAEVTRVAEVTDPISVMEAAATHTAANDEVVNTDEALIVESYLATLMEGAVTETATPAEARQTGNQPGFNSLQTDITLHDTPVAGVVSSSEKSTAETVSEE
ncbi:MAG: SMC-Scp complex subunit ScpB [Pseudomonadota bacterium]